MTICPVCSLPCKQITAQHIWKHNLSVEDFKSKYPATSLGNEEHIKRKKEEKQNRIIQDNRRCKQCNSLICNGDRNRRKYCSSSCAATYQNIHKKRITKTCNFCGRVFDTKSYNAKYCSFSCSCKTRTKRIPFKCEQCGKETSTLESKFKKAIRHFCSKKCVNMFFKGTTIRGTFNNNGHNGKSYIKPYRRLALEHFKRKCCICGYNKHEHLLHAHHKDCNKKNNVIENLLLLCPTCHGEEHLKIKEKAKQRQHSSVIEHQVGTLETPV